MSNKMQELIGNKHECKKLVFRKLEDDYCIDFFGAAAVCGADHRFIRWIFDEFSVMNLFRFRDIWV